MLVVLSIGLEWNLVDASLMASTLEIVAKEGIHNGIGLVIADKPAWHDKDVGIVVKPAQTCNLGRPTKGGAYSLMFVERHTDAFSTATDADAWIADALFDGLGQWMGKVRIVAALVIVCAEVLKCHSVVQKVFFHMLLERKACMVAG